METVSGHSPLLPIVATLIALALLLGMYFIGQYLGGKREKSRLDDALKTIKGWMEALQSVRLKKPFEGLGLRDKDYWALKNVEGGYGNDAWAAEVERIIYDRLTFYEELAGEIRSIKLVSYPGPGAAK